MTSTLFHMRNDLDEVDGMVTSLKAHLEGHLSDDGLFRFEICVAEALTNLVKHAETADLETPIDIAVTVERDTVVVEIFDPVGAVPFDLNANAVELSDVDLMAESGRGLGLILQCADKVHYGDVGGRNRMALEFGKAAA